MAVIRELLTRWGLDVDLSKVDQFDKRLLLAKKRADELGQGIDWAARRTRDSFRNMSTYVSLPIAAIGFTALSAAGNFEKGMNRVEALTTITGKSMEDLKNQAKELGRTTQFSASEAAAGMGFLAQAGFDSTKIFDAMPSTLKLAGAAQIDLASAADIVTNVMSGMGIQAAELPQTVDVLAKAFTSSNTNLQQLGQAMKFAGPVAKGFNLSLEDSVSILGLMGNAGIQASMAGTSLRGALTRLAVPTKAIQKVLNRLGVSTKDSDGKIRNLVDILLDLNKAGADATDVMEIFGQRAGPAFQNILDLGASEIQKFSGVLQNAAGTADKIQKTQLQGLAGTWIKLKSAFEGALIALGESGILDVMTSILAKITEWVQAFAELSPSTLRFLTILGALIAVVGPLGFLISSLVLAFKALAVAGIISSGSLLIIPAIIGVIIAALALFIDDFISFQQGHDSVIGKILEKWPMLEMVVRSVFAGIGQAYSETIKIVSDLFMWIDKTVKAATALFDKMKSGLSSISSSIGETVFDVVHGVDVNKTVKDLTSTVATPSVLQNAQNPIQDNRQFNIEVSAPIQVDNNGQPIDQDIGKNLVNTVRKELNDMLRQQVDSIPLEE